jgi:hypothetical protein
MVKNDKKKFQKVPQNFICEICDYYTCRKSQYDRHLLTPKHQNGNKIVKKVPDGFSCECGRLYKHLSGLSRHKNTCKVTEKPPEKSNVVIIELLKQNQEFKEILMEQSKENQKLQQQLIEMAKEGKTINNNTTTNNNFNLQLFLNEKCKDALNIDDFVGQIKLQLSDLDMIGRVGYMEGMSKIFLRNLKALDVSKRPIHCSDLKREVLYVKDKDAWEKDNSENFKIKRAIKEIECKNIKQIPKWREENPTADDTETKKHMEYQNILLEAMGGATSEDDNKKHEKIIRNIAKEVVIDKSVV